MTKHEKAFREAVKAARITRILAIKIAKADLAAAIRAMHGAATENAWYIYDARIAKICTDYDAAVERARNLLNEARQHTVYM